MALQKGQALFSHRAGGCSLPLSTSQLLLGKKKISLLLQKQENWSYFSLLAVISVKAGTVKALFSPGSSRQFCLGEIEASQLLYGKKSLIDNK